MELVNAFCIEPRLIVQAYLFLLLFLMETELEVTAFAETKPFGSG